MQNFPQETYTKNQTSFDQIKNSNEPTGNQNNQQEQEYGDEPHNRKILQNVQYKYPIIKIRFANKLFFLFLITFLCGVLCSILTLIKQISIPCEIVEILILLDYFCLALQYYVYSTFYSWGPNEKKLNFFLICSYILLILTLVGLIWQIEYGLSIVRMLSSLIFCLFYQFALIDYQNK
ncbi:unnamed protein product [Paramecium sonneborni]|uniref:Transmembrane protein n=1 Tax=Paramecium sonneborni TaxID=65129 RepID=A0A8S1PXE8_9CILI|nr:unnamed protein product [Paramecium sonneborni]